MNEPTYKTLIKAHVKFLASDESKQFDQKVRNLRDSHKRYMTAILASDVFPGLDRADPLRS